MLLDILPLYFEQLDLNNMVVMQSGMVVLSTATSIHIPNTFIHRQVAQSLHLAPAKENPERRKPTCRRKDWGIESTSLYRKG